MRVLGIGFCVLESEVNERVRLRERESVSDSMLCMRGEKNRGWSRVGLLVL